MTVVIYLLRSLANGRSYVGQTVAERRRLNNHLRLLRLGRHHSAGLQREHDQYGSENLEWFVIETCGAANAVAREQHWIDILGPELNVCPASGTVRGLRWKSKPETIAKRVASRALTMDATRQKLSAARLAHTPDQDKKRREAAAAATRRPDQHEIRKERSKRNYKPAIITEDSSRRWREGVKMAWTDGARAAQSARIKAAWERKRSAELAR